MRTEVLIRRTLGSLAVCGFVCAEDTGTRDGLTAHSTEASPTEMVFELRQVLRDYRREFEESGLDDATIDRALFQSRIASSDTYELLLAQGLDASGENPPVDSTEAGFEHAAARAAQISEQLVEAGHLPGDKLREATGLLEQMIETRLRCLSSDANREVMASNPDQGELEGLRLLKQELADIASGELDGARNPDDLYSEQLHEAAETGDLFADLAKVNREISQLQRVRPDGAILKDAVAELDRLQKARIGILQQLEEAGKEDFDQSESN